MTRLLVIFAIALCISFHVCESARILAIFPIPSFSHAVVYRKLTVELSKRGHELVIFTANPFNETSLQNYTEHPLSYEHFNLGQKLFSYGIDTWSLLYATTVLSEPVIETILSHPEMQRIIAPDSKERFDLILMEMAGFHSVHALRERLNAPMVGIASCAMNPVQNYYIGNPHALAYTPAVDDPFTNDLDFWGRLNIAYRHVRTQLVDYIHAYPIQERLLKKYFGPNVSPASSYTKEFSLILVNEYTFLGYPRPNLPNIINIGGIAADKRLKGLEAGVKKFLDGAVNGFVYFSLGSNHKSKDLAVDKLKALIGAFAELPYRVLWKWELDALPGKPDNVYISKWLPQNDVLSHPNIKVFFYQGGLQSTEEAIVNAVPMIGTPVWFDQEFNVKKIEAEGLGKRLPFDRLTYKDEIVDAIKEVATDKRYKEKVEKFSKLIDDEPMPPLARAVWWTEYVIRHKGAPHLQTKVRYMPWYQRDLYDVLLFVLFVGVSVCFLVYKSTSYLVFDVILSTSYAKTKKKLP